MLEPGPGAGGEVGVVPGVIICACEIAGVAMIDKVIAVRMEVMWSII